jgi:hypothetical protein
MPMQAGSTILMAVTWLHDEHGIDFQLSFAETGGNHNWRWGEQWLPLAACCLAAVAAWASRRRIAPQI